MRDGAHSKTQ